MFLSSLSLSPTCQSNRLTSRWFNVSRFPCKYIAGLFYFLLFSWCIPKRKISTGSQTPPRDLGHFRGISDTSARSRKKGDGRTETRTDGHQRPESSPGVPNQQLVDTCGLLQIICSGFLRREQLGCCLVQGVELAQFQEGGSA
jgi:hypothetical protein